MKNILTHFVVLLGVAFLGIAAGAQRINPNQINWPQSSGSGAPTLPCSSTNYGQPYLDTAAVPNAGYVCTATGWLPTAQTPVDATRYAGADIGLKVNAALAAAVAASLDNPVIHIPPGTYTYTNDIYLSSHATLDCSTGAVLHYTGTGNAVTVGPTNLTYTPGGSGTHDDSPYRVNGCRFTGGANMQAGIYLSPAVTAVFLENLDMIDFGNATAWNIFAQFENWYVRVDHVFMWATTSGVSYNGIKTNGYNSGAVADNGNSRILINNSYFGHAANNAQTMVYLNGFHDQIEHCTFQSFRTAAIQLGSWANDVVIDENYAEAAASTSPSFLLVGDAVGNIVYRATLRDNYVNLHNNVGYAVGDRFVNMYSGTQKIRNWTIDNNHIAEFLASSYLVNQNDLVSQPGNRAGTNYISLSTGGTEVVADQYIHNPLSVAEQWVATARIPWVDVTASPYAADSTGVVDATAAINAAYTASSNVMIPPGSYLITCDSTTDHRSTTGGIRPPSNSKTTVAAGATLTCATTTASNYNLFALQSVSNVVVQIDGTLEGNKTADLSAGAPVGSQWGWGVVFSGCAHCQLIGSGTIQNFLGDALMIDSNRTNNDQSSDLFIGPLRLTNSYRNGASILNLVGKATFQGTRFLSSTGTLPKDGVDIEPGSGNSVDTVEFIGVEASSNTGRGIDVESQGGAVVKSVRIVGGRFDSNGVGLFVYSSGIKKYSVDDVTITNSVECGSAVSTVSDGVASIKNSYYLGNATGSAPDCSQSGAFFTASAGFEFSGNLIRLGSSANQIYGIHVISNTGTNRIINNDLAGSATTTTSTNEYHSFSESTSDLTCGNRLSGGIQDCVLGGNIVVTGLKLTDQGTCTMSSGACAGQNLGHTYAAAPKCVGTWNGTGTLTGLLKLPSTTTTTTPASSVGTDTAQVNWACFGN